MRLRVRGTVYEGRAVDLRTRAVDGAAMAAAVRGERTLPVTEADATPVYDYCGHVHPEMGLQTKTALAAAARSRGRETVHDGGIADLREELSAEPRSAPDLPPAREPVPSSTIAELRERAASQRGRLQARERLGAASDETEDALRETARRLTERETERTAAEERRKRRRELAREYRDRLADRRRLADRLANRRRDAREALVEQFRDQFRSALESVPGPTPSDPFDAPPVTAALAILRVARTPAPLVLEVDRFETPAAAAETLGGPVVRC